jgi:Glycosyl hydrolase family 3 C-terminal domain
MRYTWFAFGVFDRAAYVNDDNQIDEPAHARDAIGIEQQAATLLRNADRLLPLNARKLHRIAVIGKAANTYVTGGGSGSVTPFQLTTRTASSSRWRRPTRTPWSCWSPAAPDLTPWRQQVGALLETWYPGGRGGTAVAGVLFGDADPDGRLPFSLPASAGHYPTAGDPAEYPGIANQVDNDEGLDVGYRCDRHQHRQAARLGGTRAVSGDRSGGPGRRPLPEVAAPRASRCGR